MNKIFCKKLFIVCVLIVFFAHRVFATKPDYLANVNLEKYEKGMEKLKNSPYREVLTQKTPILNIQNSTFYNGKSYKPIFKVKVEDDDTIRKNKIAITFDDSFVKTYTHQILDILDKHNCKATFFITDRVVLNNPEDVVTIVKRGHEIANHSTTHAPFKNLHTERAIWELNTIENMVKELTGITMTLFRFPTGSYSDPAVLTATNLGYFPIQWSIESGDTSLKSSEKILQRIKSQKAKSGDIVLLHNGPKASFYALDNILSYYDSLGLGYLKISDLIYENNFYVNERGEQVLKK